MNPPNVELIYDSDCPNVAESRVRLLRAFAAVGLPPRWREWVRDAPDSPAYAHRFGSPTILVDGKDVVEPLADTGESANCCRVYVDERGSFDRAPPTSRIVQSLIAASSGPVRWRRLFGALPAVAVVLLPKLTCAACWPLYAGVLSSLGIGFVNYTPWLLPLSAAFLAIALFTLGFRARSRRGYGPALLGAAAAGIVLVGKFAFESDPALYAGAALLTAASVWNAWPASGSRAACAECPPAAAGETT